MEMTDKQKMILNYMESANSDDADIIETILGMRVTPFFSTAISVSKIEWLQTVNMFVRAVLTNEDYSLSKRQQTILDYMKEQYSSEILDIMELIWRMEIKPIFNEVRNLTSEEKLQVIKNITEWALEYEKEWALKYGA